MAVGAGEAGVVGGGRRASVDSRKSTSLPSGRRMTAAR